MTTHQLNSFRVLQIDHVELFVPDRHEAAGWYQRILGLDVVPAYQDWAADPGGPLMISSDGEARSWRCSRASLKNRDRRQGSIGSHFESAPTRLRTFSDDLGTCN